jgi:hypothetical protein
VGRPGSRKHLAIELDVAINDDGQREFLIDAAAGGRTQLLRVLRRGK